MHLLELFGRDADEPVQGNACTGEEGGKEVAVIVD
jgi:hypothetical protein